MACQPAELRRMTDDELIEAHRLSKTETGGKGPALTPPEDDPVSAIREEMERRGLTPDSEDGVPDTKTAEGEPVMDDHA